MTDPAAVHAALLAAIDKVAEGARAAHPVKGWYSVTELQTLLTNSDDEDRFSLENAAHMVTQSPDRVIDRCDRDRARAERHRPEIVSWTTGSPPHQSAHCVTCLEELEDYPHDVGPFSVNWPCPEYADLLADYRIKVPDA